MSVATFNTVTCLIIAAMCVWSELSKHTTSSTLLSLGRGMLAITSLVEGSGFFFDQELAIPQVMMNAAMAFLLLVLFYNTQIAVLRKAATHQQKTILQVLTFWH